MKKQEVIAQLYKKFLTNSCSTVEVDLLLEHFKAADTTELLSVIDAGLMAEDDLSIASAEEEVKLNIIFKAVKSVTHPEVSHAVGLSLYKRGFSKYIAAACVALVIGMTILFYNHRTTDLVKHDLNPGSNRAVLTLANGKAVVLSDTKTGVVVDAAKLTYNDGSKVQVSSGRASSLYSKVMELSTPRGGNYQLILPDGTKVWLNAASSLKFPASFAGLKARVIELSGEAYFEVSKAFAPDQKKTRVPFIVKTPRQEVEVLGTHFNISSYIDEEAVKTTLLEGSVKVSQNDNTVMLRPGEQSSLTTGSKNLKVGIVDTEDVMAWKNGYFLFDNDNFKGIMNKIARWYDAEIVYESVPENLNLGGRISRRQKLSAVLKALEATGKVHFKIEGRRITVID